MERIETDVVVIGAGLSGLNAARTLVRQGLSVVVLEAKQSVGGRLETLQLTEDQQIEGGGRFVGPGQEDVLRLAAELGVETFDCVRSGKALLCLDGGRVEFDLDTEVPTSEAGQAEFFAAMEELERLSARIDVSAPWQGPDADRLDNTSLATWLDEQFTDEDAKYLFANTIVSLAGVAARTSLLYAALFVATAGGFEKIATGESWRFVGGPSALIDRMAQELGDRIHVSTPVHVVQWTADSVLIQGAELEVAARRAVVAMSPSEARHLEFLPALPWARRAFHQNAAGIGWINVGMLVYETPFWREAGLSGDMISDMPGAPWTFDCSPIDANVGVLLAFQHRLLNRSSESDDVPDPYDTERGREEAMVEAVVAGFGDRAREYTAYLEKDWGDEPFFSGACIGLPPGLLTEVRGARLDPVGPFHWCSSDQSTRWFNWMNGAVESSDRAAAAVVASLSTQPV